MHGMHHIGGSLQARRKQFWIGGGGGGGQRPKGAHDFFFFCQGLISGVASFLVWGGGRVPMYRERKIAHRTRGSICYHNFPNILLV